MKYITNNIDDKIKAKTNIIRLALIKLGNIIPKRHRHIIRKDLHGIEKNKNSHKKQKEKIYSNLIDIANILDKKEEHKYSDYDDLDYFGIRRI